MIKKFKFMVKGVENPLADFVIRAIRHELKGKDNYLIRCRYYTQSELDGFVDRANAAWESVCEYVKSEEICKVSLEISLEENMKPYIRIIFGGKHYKIAIPERADGLESLKKEFGEYYVNEHLYEAVYGWINGDYIGSLWSGNMKASQETDRFVIYESGIWSVDSGELESSNEFDTETSYIFTYKRASYKKSKLEFEFGDELVVVESGDGILQAELCNVEQIRMKQLIELEKLYRDGRSNLPDSVFDKVMAQSGVSEEELQTACGECGYKGHYNSYGVSSEISSAMLPYPARAEILSQNKVRDVEKLNEIVRSWGGRAVVSWKLDGCAVRLYYKGPNFVRAVTKGKARDVTELMRGLRGFPTTIYHGYPIIESSFKDTEWFVTGELVAVNARRSVAAGYLLRKDYDSDETVEISEQLEFFAYDSDICKHYPENKMVAPITLYSQMLNLLGRECGFNVVELSEFNGGIRDDDLPELPQSFDVDGLVVRVNDIKKYEAAGETSHHPKGSVAFKFEDTWYKVKPKLIYGKNWDNNVVKLIAEFKPIVIDGKSVSSAVWQPKSDPKLCLEYDSRLWRTKSCGYKVMYGLGDDKVPFGEAFNVDEIEVCLRGRVIPQWRLVSE